MANDYNYKLEILPEMELAKHLIENRKTTAVRAPRTKLAAFLRSKDKRELRENNNRLADQLHDWFLTVVYGFPKKPQGTFKVLGMNFDTAKTVDWLNKYTAFNLLGLNLVQGTANAVLAETMQIAENIAGEYMSRTAYIKGTGYYMFNLPGN